MSSSFLTPAQLWPRTCEATARALASGALQPIATECHTLASEGARFQVRVLGQLQRREKAERTPLPEGVRSPFELPEPDLTVGELSATHRCLLNKFPVVGHHLLVVTRAFAPQESLLTVEDFTALAVGLAGLDGLAFYNGGEVAGASQAHKHLQLVPPLGPEGLRAPLEALLPRGLSEGRVGQAPVLGLAHALTGLSLAGRTPEEAGVQLASAYGLLRGALGLAEGAPYNLLATREWMLLVPRARAEAEGININGLGFAGSLLVRTPQLLQVVAEKGPLTLLRAVALPPLTAHTPGAPRSSRPPA